MLNQLATLTGNVCVGRVVQVTADGQALVEFPGNLLGPVAARSLLTSSPGGGHGEAQDLPVLLAFENGDPGLPIIVGVVREQFCPPAPQEAVTVAAASAPEAVVDGRKVTLSAREEIVLRCGQGSITLRKDGKIIVKGTQLVSRASGTNKIQGATVQLN